MPTKPRNSLKKKEALTVVLNCATRFQDALAEVQKKNTSRMVLARQGLITHKACFLHGLQLIITTAFTVLYANKDGKMWEYYIQIYEKNEKIA